MIILLAKLCLNKLECVGSQCKVGGLTTNGPCIMDELRGGQG